MEKDLFVVAETVEKALYALPQVKRCTLYGSLAKGLQDELSDVDIEVDVSGCDNSEFALALPQLLAGTLPVVYADYAPSLAPEKYVVSLALDETDPFCIVDLCCTAQPHCATVSRQQLARCNDPVAHTFKLWTANLKHFSRGADCYDDILRMAKKLGSFRPETKGGAELLEEALCWLERNAPQEKRTLAAACRDAFERLLC